MDLLLILSVRLADGENVKKETSGRGQGERAKDIETALFMYFIIHSFIILPAATQEEKVKISIFSLKVAGFKFLYFKMTTLLWLILL